MVKMYIFMSVVLKYRSEVFVVILLELMTLYIIFSYIFECRLLLAVDCFYSVVVLLICKSKECKYFLYQCG